MPRDSKKQTALKLAAVEELQNIFKHERTIQEVAEFVDTLSVQIGKPCKLKMTFVPGGDLNANLIFDD